MMSPPASIDPEEHKLQSWLNAIDAPETDPDADPLAPAQPKPKPVDVMQGTAPVTPPQAPTATPAATPTAAPSGPPAWKRGLQIGAEGLDALFSGLGGKHYDAGYYRGLENRADARQSAERAQARETQQSEQSAALKRERSDPNSATNKRLQANVAKALQADPQAFAGMTVEDYAQYGGDVVKAQLAAKQRERDEKQREAMAAERARVAAEAAKQGHQYDLDRDKQRPYHPPPSARIPKPTGDDFSGLEDL